MRSTALLSTALLLGAAFWATAEIMESLNHGFYAASNMVAAAGFAGMSLGVILLWNDARADRLGRAGTATASAGMAMLSLFILSSVMLGLDVRTEAQMAEYPMFIFASMVIFIGMGLLGIWILSTRAYAAWVGYTFMGGTLFTLAVIFVLPQLLGLQILANLTLAAALAEVAVINSNKLTRSPRRARGS